ncbi:MAG TPA: tetratricopeptide repeat protein, partial [Candidatus Obscuribacterales bacterium]
KRGYALVQLGSDRDAIASFNKALKLKPDYASAFYNKASCYALRGDVGLALDNLQQAIALNPRYREEAQSDIAFEELLDDESFRQLVEA